MTITTVGYDSNPKTLFGKLIGKFLVKIKMFTIMINICIPKLFNTKMIKRTSI